MKSRKKSKKSQIKMMETIAVLLVFLILLVFVMIFYIKMSQSTNTKAKVESANLKAVEIAQFASFMPELQCSSKNIIEENCFDAVKIGVFRNITINDSRGRVALNTTYFDVFENSRIAIAEVYPNNRSWVIYERRPQAKRLDERTVFIPVSIYDPIETSYSFGMLNVTTYS